MPGPRTRRLLVFVLLSMSLPMTVVDATAQAPPDPQLSEAGPAHDHSGHRHGGEPADPTEGRRRAEVAAVTPIADAGAPRPRKDPCAPRGLRLLPRSRRCTHGADPVPEGFDIATRPAALSPGAAAAVAPFECDGDGTSGLRTQVLYVRSSDVADRFAQYLPSFKQWAAEADQFYRESAADTGGNRRIRFVHDASCEPVVSPVVLSTAGDNNFDNTIDELQAKGYNRADRKYMLFVDAFVYCGIGTIQGDDSAGSSNANNGGPSYGRTDAGCWNGGVAAHEHMHNLGGVQLTAPHTSGGWHCVDEYDRMCYSDTPNYPGMQYVCPDSARDALRFDCNYDDYFNADPASGSYLATHWNTYDSPYLVGAVGTTCSDRGLEPDNSASQARTLAAGISEKRAFCDTNDQDWTSFQAVAGRSYSIETLALASGTDTVVDLYGSDGTSAIASNDDRGDGSLSSLIDFTAPTDGRLYLRVTQADGGGGFNLTYELRIGMGCPDSVLEPDNSPSMARSVALGATESHSYCTPGDQDWIKFDVTSGGVYTAETSNLGPSVDTYLELYGPDGSTRVAYNDDFGGSLASRLTHTATSSGTHYLKSRHFSAAEGQPALTYDLKVSQSLSTLSVNDASVTEGSSGTKNLSFAVSRTGTTTGGSSVTYATENGSAVAPGDYTAVPATTLTFAAGETAKTVSVAVRGDTTVEPDEQLTLRLSGSTNAVISDGAGTGTILNDDVARTFAVNDVSVAEGSSGTRYATFTVTRTGSTTTSASVRYATASVTASSSTDYAARYLTTLGFSAGQSSRTVTVSVRGDTVIEPDETFQLRLSSPSTGTTIADGTGVGTIVNDDLPNAFSVNDVSVAEPDSVTQSVTFTVTRSGATGGSASVRFATVDGTATAPTDYTAKALTTLTFSAGQASRTVTVTVRGDLTVEADESFLLRLSEPSTGASISDDTGVGTIVNDD